MADAHATSAATSAAEPAATANAQAVALAQQVGAAMFAVDNATRFTMGITLVECTPGRAVMQMRVQDLHLNGHQICHGGFIFTLADSSFAFACNSRNRATVASGGAIEFLKSGQLGDLLTCVATEQVLQGRHGIYDMQVTNQHGDVVAVLRGKSAQIPGTVLKDS